MLAGRQLVELKASWMLVVFVAPQLRKIEKEEDEPKECGCEVVEMGEYLSLSQWQRIMALGGTLLEVQP